MIAVIVGTIFGVYLFSLSPALLAYRDAGEFVVSGLTLGVAHPPGYPLYILLNRIVVLILPFGNYAWRLNIFSAFVGAVSLLLFSGIIQRLGKSFSGSLIKYPVVFIPAFSYLYWCLATVCEPYILNVFFALAVIYFLLGDGREQLLAWFIFGVGLCNRLDMILLFPVLFLTSTRKTFKYYRYGLLFLILGLSLYLYLPIRARTNPWFNWNNPQNFSSLVATLSRRSYGHSLDLIASGYAPGENFLPGIIFYFKQLFLATGYLGIFPIFGGAFGLAKNRPKLFWLLIICFLLTGPIFIYLANMPPNPYSFAILQDSFLLPDILLFLFLGMGIVFLGSYRFPLAVFLLLVLVVVNFYNGRQKNFYRFNFTAYDYARNIFCSCPPKTILVQKKDGQLFTTWWFQIAQKRRQDIVSIAQGLSGSGWYQQMIKQRYPDVKFSRLNDRYSIENLLNQNLHRPIALAVDTEVELPDLSGFKWQGLVWRKSLEFDFSFENFYIWRQKFSDFFSQNLFTDYGRSFHNRGVEYLFQKEHSLARRNFLLAYYFDETLAVSLSFRAYTYLKENDLLNAEKSYQQCIQSYLRVIQLAQKYKAFPDVINSFKKDLAGAYANLGVVKERLGRLKEAKEVYQAGIAISPSAQLYFNLASLYWKENDFVRAKECLFHTLQIDPDYPRAKFYYQMLLKKLPGQ